MQQQAYLLAMYLSLFLGSLLTFSAKAQDEEPNSACLVPWMQDGDIAVKGPINDDLLTVNPGIRVVLSCRARYAVFNGSSTSTCNENGIWWPMLGVCAPLPKVASTTTAEPTTTTRRTTTREPTRTTSFKATTQGARRADDTPYSCGLSKHMFAGSRDDRILGQSPAMQNEFPWLARLVLRERTNMICSGSVLQVYVGGHRLKLADTTEKVYETSQQLVHPLYQEETRDYNFALVQTSEPMAFDENINKICLLRNYCQGESRPGDRCAVAGWNTKNRRDADVLRKNEARIGWQFECKTSMPGFEPTERMTCAGFPSVPFDKENDTPDIGQPLVCAASNGSYFLNGLFSHRRQVGIQKANNGSVVATLVTDIYARPCSVQQWIQQIITSLTF